MIIDKSYFKGEIYIPHASPSISDSVTGVSGEVDFFIEEYVYECLFKSLGSVLANGLIAELDSNKTNGLKDTADSKWNDLLNGKTYTDPATSKEVVWRGIRFKTADGGNYNRSFLAYYVYFFYESNDFITRSDAGNQREQAKNAVSYTPTQKVAKAWRKFVTLVQGESEYPTVINTQYGVGVDYYGQGDEEVSLYKFIKDSNTIAEDTYADFNPKTWKRLTEFGI